MYDQVSDTYATYWIIFALDTTFTPQDSTHKPTEWIDNYCTQVTQSHVTSGERSSHTDVQNYSKMVSRAFTHSIWWVELKPSEFAGKFRTPITGQIIEHQCQYISKVEWEFGSVMSQLVEMSKISRCYSIIIVMIIIIITFHSSRITYTHMTNYTVGSTLSGN